MSSDSSQNPAAAPQPHSLHDGRFEGRLQFEQLIRDALAQAAQEGWSEIIFCDPTFADWPLGETAIAEALQAWAHSKRRFTMLAWHYDAVAMKFARFVQWRRAWSHIVHCFACPEAEAQELPSAIWSPRWAMGRLDMKNSAGWYGREPQRRVDLKQNLDEWLERATPAFPATTLGLG